MANKLLNLATPAYVYDGAKIKEKCQSLRKYLPGFTLSYACKANDNKEVIKLIAGYGYDIETVSPGEIKKAKDAGVPYSKMTFTAGNIEKEELISIFKKGIRVHLDSLHQIETIGKNFPGSDICIRLNLNVGAGHHSHVVTSGPDSKFGLDLKNLKEAAKLIKKYNLKIVGLHQHIGSNVLEVATLVKAMKEIAKMALNFPDLKYLDFGGSMGVPYKKNDKSLNLKSFGTEAGKLQKEFMKKFGRKITMSFEPGRFLVAEAGQLLVTVTDIKKNERKIFVGVNSGMNHLIRPAIYNSHHEILNLSRKGGRKIKADVVGQICESGDFFAKDRTIIEPRIGDVLAIQNAGAYGYVMASTYNSRSKPKEYLILGNKIKEI